MDKVLVFAKKILKNKIDKNSVVVDATCGNGNDTLFLAKNTPAKKVYAFDIQELAIKNTKRLLFDNAVLDKCTLILDSHNNFEKYVAEPISAAVFNLGYLPKGDHSITTLGKVTKNTINNMLCHLEVGGVIVVVVYWGHENGKFEKELLLDYCSSLDQKYIEVLQYQFINQRNNAPFIIALEKLKEISF